MNKKIIYFLFFCFFLSVSPTNQVYASRTDSEAAVNFFQVEEPIFPVTPGDHEPLDPETIPPGTGGLLSVDYISNWVFEVHTITKKSELYGLQEDHVSTISQKDKKVPNFVEVSDHRGESSGWTLYIKQEGQFHFNEHELLGAEVVIDEPKLETLDDGFPPKTMGTIHLNPDYKWTPVLQAGERQGTGTWLATFGGSEEDYNYVRLDVPADTEKAVGSYKTVFSWMLVSGEI